MILAVVIAYLLVVMLVGVLGHRLFRGTGEDYFLASRTIGPFVLLMTLVGTNMTAFTILGASGEAYRQGVRVFALMGSSSALVIPFLFYFVGTRCWWLGKRNGYLTQVQFIRDRYDSGALGTLLFVVLILLMLPYMLIGVKGGGDALTAITGGPLTGVPSWVGSLLVCAVIFVYVTYGGMRSTAWANTFQTMVFMVVGGVAFFVIADHYGGVGGAMETLRENHRDLVVFGTGRFQTVQMLSYLLLPLSVGAFPHLFSHWLSAKDAAAFRSAIVLYPLCFAVVWFPSVTLGVIGRIDFPPPLDGPILVKLILSHAGGLLAGCLAAGVFAAIMSSLDSQSLALGTMFTQDIVRHYGFDNKLSEKQQVFFGRVFVALFLVLAFLCSLVATQSIFALGVWSLTGFAGLLPILVVALYWKRSTKQGAAAAILAVAGLWVYFFGQSLQSDGPYTVGGTGLMPVAVIVPASLLALTIVSLATAPPARISKFFPGADEPPELRPK